ncbi:hypothetical protein [Amycolatopsis sp. GM8]|uniref:hypothetical protein n=1 Tax=Amycolatopsis sp. GM8 TaxID=2896530 RepID=UPI001F219DA5|nr:hypothetical protein [Amycolatopsis sp. GM8]
MTESMADESRSLSSWERIAFFLRVYDRRPRPIDGKTWNQKTLAEFVYEHVRLYSRAQISKFLKGEIANPGSKVIAASALYLGVGDHWINPLRPWPGDAVARRYGLLVLEINEPDGFTEFVRRLNWIVTFFAEKERPEGGGYSLADLAEYLSDKTGERWLAVDVGYLLYGHRPPGRLLSVEALTAIADFFHATVMVFRLGAEWDEGYIGQFLEARRLLGGLPVAARNSGQIDLAGLVQVAKAIEREQAMSAQRSVAEPQFLAPPSTGGE